MQLDTQNEKGEGATLTIEREVITLAQKVAVLEQNQIIVEKRQKDMDDKQQEYEIEQAIVKSDVKNVLNKMDKMDNNITWVLRLIIGSIITFAIGLLLKSGGAFL